MTEKNIPWDQKFEKMTKEQVQDHYADLVRHLSLDHAQNALSEVYSLLDMANKMSFSSYDMNDPTYMELRHKAETHFGLARQQITELQFAVEECIKFLKARYLGEEAE